MTARRTNARPQASFYLPWGLALRRATLLLLGFLAITAAGCRGCDSQQAEDDTDQLSEEDRDKLAEEKKKKKDLEIGPLLPLLGQDLSEDESSDLKSGILVKPGHWTPTVQQMQANYDDFVGRTSATLVDERRQPTILDHTHFTYQSTRPVVLAKGRKKMVEGQLFVPEHDAGKYVRSRLINRNSGAEVDQVEPLLVRMPSYQYSLVVLAKESSRYGFLKVTDSVRAEWEEEYDESPLPHYRVALADTSDRLPLPTSLLSWTTIAYLVWDEVDATQLTAEQQQALLDWLHWGGRLIINGPDSLDTLRGTFLDDYLPADGAGPRNISTDDLRGWSDYWGKRIQGEPLPPLEPSRSISAVMLTPRKGARELPGDAGLFYEGNVGRGTIVVSAVQLTQRELVNWPGYDGFLNAALLGRPRRYFSEGPYGGMRVTWAELPKQRLDAHLTSGLRLFARDAGAQANVRVVESTNTTPFGTAQTDMVMQVDRLGGVAAWNEFGPVSNTARDLLVEAAGVQMPSAGFIVACLMLYLAVLVPLNWIVFHTLGRVEWAWIAAPVVAILGTIAVVRLAQLDIGFVRSQTEIALLELQGDHPRGLLSRYTAFYSSLSTTYDVAFDEANTVATPFPAREDESLKTSERPYEVSFEQHADTVLRGLAVSSNSTRMLHSEQLIDLEGPLKLGLSSRNNPQVENRTGLNLRDVVVVRRYFQGDSDQPLYDASWIGDLRSGATAVLGLTQRSWSDDQLPFADDRTRAARGNGTESLNVDELLKLAFLFPQANDPRYARREEYRLVGQVAEVLSGAEVNPNASQIQGVTVVLAHLEYGDLPQAQADVNSRGDVKITKTNLFED